MKSSTYVTLNVWHALQSNEPEESPMRSASFLLVATVVFAGCTVTVKTQTKFVGDQPVTKTASRSVASGDVVEIENGNGDVVVQGGSGDKITLSTKVFSFADVKGDADLALADVVNTIAIDESAGKFYIHCNKAASAHGSAGTGTTGCDAFTVQVPSGTATAPLNLKATAHNGQINASGLTGTAVIHTDNGNATASLGIAPAAVIEVSSGNGDVSLALPANFTADAIVLTPGGPGAQKITTDFPDLDSAASTHKAAGGAKSITLTTENGTVTLRKQ
jgi:hypothetical protein